jgi:hypothetical protein
VQSNPPYSKVVVLYLTTYIMRTDDEVVATPELETTEEVVADEATEVA